MLFICMNEIYFRYKFFYVYTIENNYYIKLIIHNKLTFQGKQKEVKIDMKETTSFMTLKN